jgi:hypothetical protein
MESLLYLQFHQFRVPGVVPCANLEEAQAFFRAYDGNQERCEREGVRAIWVTHGGATVLGQPPSGWVPNQPGVENTAHA